MPLLVTESQRDIYIPTMGGHGTARRRHVKGYTAAQLAAPQSTAVRTPAVPCTLLVSGYSPDDPETKALGEPTCRHGRAT